MSSIFLSHNHADKPFVRRLARDLQVAGVRVWMDEAEMMIGDSLIEKIRQGIDEMEYLGVILSQNSVKSDWVKREVDIAMNQEIEGKRVKVLPLVIEDCDPPGFLKGKLYADFRSPERYREELEKVLRRTKDGIMAEAQIEAREESFNTKLRLEDQRKVEVTNRESKFKIFSGKKRKLVLTTSIFIILLLIIFVYSISQKETNIFITESVININEIDDIKIDDSLKITEIQYGDGANIKHVKADELLILDKDVKVKNVEKNGGFVIQNLFPEDSLNNLRTNEKLHFPRYMTVYGKKTRADRMVALFSVKDKVYPPKIDSTKGETFEIKRPNGRGGIAEFVDERGNFHAGHIGKEYGGVGVLVAIEFEGKRLLCRSQYVVIVRKGIRYPNDIWLSKKTNKPITQLRYTDLSKAKFIFQSRELYSNASDIFVADFNGDRMYNLTEDNQSANDEFFDEEGHEVAEWVDETHIRYSSMSGGARKLMTKRLPRG